MTPPESLPWDIQMVKFFRSLCRRKPTLSQLAAVRVSYFSSCHQPALPAESTQKTCIMVPRFIGSRDAPVGHPQVLGTGVESGGSGLRLAFVGGGFDFDCQFFTVEVQRLTIQLDAGRNAFPIS